MGIDDFVVSGEKLICILYVKNIGVIMIITKFYVLDITFFKGCSWQ